MDLVTDLLKDPEVSDTFYFTQYDAFVEEFCYTLLTLKYEVKTPIHKSHLHTQKNNNTRTGPFVSE